jgi:Holliday junction resolvase RusA-like endonuclease
VITLAVDGMPQTKGSWKVIMRRGRAVLIPDNDAEPTWAQIVGWAAKAKLRNGVDVPLFTGRWRVDVEFTLLPPPSKRKTNRRDLDKLVRSILDALTGIVWCDDEQVDELHLSKTVGEKPGAIIVLTPIP